MLGIVVVLGASGPLARAEAPETKVQKGRALELSWEAPRDCTDAGSVRRDVERVLGSNSEIRRQARVRGEVKKAAEGWSVTLTLVTEAGRSVRTLTAPSCEALTRASAVVIAFTLTGDESDPEPAADANQSSSIEPDRALPPPTPEARRRSASVRPRPPPPETLHLGPTVGLFLRGDAGTLPDPAIGPGILVGWHAPSIFLEATFGWLFGADKEIVPPAQRRATISHAGFSAFFARIGVCPASSRTSLERGPLRVLACAGFGALQTRVTGHPLAPESADGVPRASQAPNNEVEGWSGSAFVGPRLRYERGWFAMSASADAAVPFRRQDFVLLDRSGGAQTVHRSPSVLVGISLAVELTFFQ